MMIRCSKLAILFLVSLAAPAGLAMASPASAPEQNPCRDGSKEVIYCAEDFIKNLAHGQIALSQNCCHILLDKSLHACWAPTHKPNTKPFTSKEEKWILDLITKYCDSGKAPNAVPLFSLAPAFPLPEEVSPVSHDIPISEYEAGMEPAVEDYNFGPSDDPV